MAVVWNYHERNMMECRARFTGPDTLRLITNSLPDLADGEVVLVSIERGRSASSHKHQFAWLHDAWASLPESLMFEDWAATPETMRKRALIECGYYEQAIVDCSGDKAAREVAKALGAARRAANGYAVAVVRDGVAIVRWPESQSVKAMGGKRFQESKTKIMDWVAGKLGVASSDLGGVSA